MSVYADNQGDDHEDDEDISLADVLEERADDVLAGDFVTFEEHAKERSD